MSKRTEIQIEKEALRHQQEHTREREAQRFLDLLSHQREMVLDRFDTRDSTAHTVARRTADELLCGVLQVLDGTEQNNGYYVIPREQGVLCGPDVSGNLVKRLFDEINS